MRLRGVAIFFAVFVFAAALSNGQGAMAVEPGPVAPAEAKIIIEEKKDLVILDVRNPSEYVVVHFPDALNIPVNELEARFAEVPADRPVLVHCGIGKRAARGYQILKEKRKDIKELYFINGEPLFN